MNVETKQNISIALIILSTSFLSFSQQQVDQDTIVFEAYDLSIIDSEAKVIEIQYARSSKQTTP